MIVLTAGASFFGRFPSVAFLGCWVLSAGAGRKSFGKGTGASRSLEPLRQSMCEGGR